MSHLRKSLLGRNLKRPGFTPKCENFLPSKWSQYYDSEEFVSIKDNNFHYYRKGNTGPAIVCLHGGGYSGLTWALFATEITNLVECQIIGIDLRGHGSSKTDDDTDLSLDTLAKDVADVVSHLFSLTVPVVLVGHSMGGAVAVEASQMIPNTVSLCVIDVVEGTALDALSSMQSILRGRPSYFRSMQQAIQWCYKSGQTHNLEAAKISMPGQIVNAKTGTLAANETEKETEANIGALGPPARSAMSILTIQEEDEDSKDKINNDCGKPPLPKTVKTDNIYCPKIEDTKYNWRIDLSKTECFWTGWFKGLSEKFLELQIPKLLMLASINGLDTKLTVGQMQGKFQLQVLNKSGHAIHEDQPEKVAEILSSYLVKQRLVVAKCVLSSNMPGC